MFGPVEELQRRIQELMAERDALRALLEDCLSELPHDGVMASRIDAALLPGEA